MTRVLHTGPDVVVVGSLNLDLVVRAPRLPRPGETLIGSDFATDEGGKGANQAVAAARMGARVAMVGRIGRDAHGGRLRAALQREGVDDAGVGDDDDRPTGVASIVVAAGGENCIVVVPGANHALQPRHVEACATLLATARIVVLQFEIPMPAVIAALQYAHAGSATTLLNAAPAAELATSTFALVDWLIVNEEEAGSLLGPPVTDPAQARTAAAALRTRGPRHVVVTLGAAGLVHVDATGALFLGAPPVRAVDSTGAGDTFVGALAAALAQGVPADAALRWGQAAAALAVTQRGTQSAMPTRAQVLAHWGDPATQLFPEARRS
jgi:ribokinase